MNIKKIKNLMIILSAFSIMLFICNSCSTDDEPSTSSNSYSFKDQNLQGKIAGVDWVFVSGISKESSFETGKLDISLFPVANADPCNTSYYSLDYQAQVMFSITKSAGIYELKFDMNDSTKTQTATFYTPSDSLNNIASSGAIEITSISDTQVTGKIDIKIDNNNFINGNFATTYCPKQQ